MATLPFGSRANSILDLLFKKDEEQPQMSAADPDVTAMMSPGSLAGRLDNMSTPPGMMSPAEKETQMARQMSPMPAQPQQPTVSQDKTAQLKAADQLTRQMAAGGDKDPSFMDKVSNYFGDEGNMLRLAMAFNTMRLNPDQQLAAYAAKRLETLGANKLSAQGAKSIAAQLFKMGYKDYALQALQNPTMAAKIYEQVIQKDLAPGATDKISGVQQTKDGKQFVVVTPARGGESKIQWLGTTGETQASKNEAELVKTKWEISINKSEKAMEQADNLYNKIGLYQQAIDVAQRAQDKGEDVGGLIRSRFPSFTEETALFRSIKNQLGISVINSATFGALSEGELKLALATEIDDNLQGQDLINYMKAKQAATLKLYQAMAEEAGMLSSMQWDDYVADRNKRREINLKYMNMPAPANVDKDLWNSLSPDERRRTIGE